MKTIIVKQKEREYEPAGLIIALILLVALLISSFIFAGKIIEYFNNVINQDNQVEINTDPQYDRLLKILNDNVKTTEVVPNEKGDKLTSFNYSSNIFTISAYSSDTVYYYEIDLSSTSSSDITSAYNYLLTNDVEGSFVIDLTRYVNTKDNQLDSKYPSENYLANYTIGNMGSINKVYGSILNKNNGDIYVIDNVDLDEVLLDSFSPITISKSNNLYSIYKNIASR